MRKMRITVSLVLSIVVISEMTTSFEGKKEDIASQTVRLYGQFKQDWDITQILIDPKSPNILWIAQQNGYAYKFLKDSKGWENLQKVIGGLAYGIIDIRIDPYNSNQIWLGGYNGVANYLKREKKWKIYSEIPRVSSFEFDKNYIWIATHNGLWRIDRKTEKIKQIKETSRIWILSLIKDGNKIWLGTFKSGLLIYDTLDKKFSKIREKDGFSLNGIKKIYKWKDKVICAGSEWIIVFDQTYKSWHLLHHKGRPIVEGGRLWCYSYMGKQGLEKIDLSTMKGEIVLPNTFIGKPLFIDKENLWFGSNIGIGRYNLTSNDVSYLKGITPKSMALDGGYLLTGVKEGLYCIDLSKAEFIKKEDIKSKEERTERVFNSIKEEADVVEKIKRYEKVIKDIKDVECWRIISSLKVSSFEDREKVLNYLQTHPTTMMKDILYYILATSYFSSEKFEESLKYFTNLRNLSSEGRLAGEIKEEELKRFKEEIEKIKDIEERFKDDPPRRLWELGNLYLKIIKKSWNEAEVGYANTELAFNKFEKIIDDYPKSEWADDAEYKMLLYCEELSHEGGDQSYNLDAILKYRHLIYKYPNSDLIPKILLRIGDLFVWYADPNFGAQVYDPAPYYKLALGEYERIIKEYPESEVCGQAYLGIADVLWKMNSPEEAFLYYQRAIERLNEGYQIEEAKRMVLQYKDTLHQIEKLNEDLKVASGDEAIHLSLKIGDLYGGIKCFDKAREYYKKALSKGGKYSAKAQFNIAKTYFFSTKYYYPKVITFVDSFFNIDRINPEVYHNSYNSNALREYQKVIEGYPEEKILVEEAKYQMAVLYDRYFFDHLKASSLYRELKEAEDDDIANVASKWCRNHTREVAVLKEFEGRAPNTSSDADRLSDAYRNLRNYRGMIELYKLMAEKGWSKMAYFEMANLYEQHFCYFDLASYWYRYAISDSLKGWDLSWIYFKTAQLDELYYPRSLEAAKNYQASLENYFSPDLSWSKMALESYFALMFYKLDLRDEAFSFLIDLSKKHPEYKEIANMIRKIKSTKPFFYPMERIPLPKRFCPIWSGTYILTEDIDGDGVDEIYLIDNREYELCGFLKRDGKIIEVKFHPLGKRERYEYYIDAGLLASTTDVNGDGRQEIILFSYDLFQFKVWILTVEKNSFRVINEKEFEGLTLNSSHSFLKASDIDNDGRKEIIFATSGDPKEGEILFRIDKVYLFEFNEDDILLQELSLPPQYLSSMDIGDINSDGNKELLFGTSMVYPEKEDQVYIVCYRIIKDRLEEVRRIIKPFEDIYTFHSEVTYGGGIFWLKVDDLDLDGRLEILIGIRCDGEDFMHYTMIELKEKDLEFEVTWRSQEDLYQPTFGPFVANLTEKKKKEIILDNHMGYFKDPFHLFLIYGGDTQKEYVKEWASRFSNQILGVGNFDGDKEDELLSFDELKEELVIWDEE